MKKIIRSIIIFWGILALFPLFYLIYGFFTYGEGSFWLFGVGDGLASTTAWVDSNTNGIQDPDEKSLANVCIWYGYSPEAGSSLDSFCEFGSVENRNITDDEGKWGQFLPGGKCSEVFIFAKTPEGFQATTNLASDGCNAKFGFVAQGVQVKQQILSVDEFIWQRTLFTWITRIIVGLVILVVSVGGTIWLQTDLEHI